MAVVGPVGAGKVNYCLYKGFKLRRCLYILAVQLTSMYTERATCIEGSYDSAR